MYVCARAWVGKTCERLSITQRVLGELAAQVVPVDLRRCSFPTRKRGAVVECGQTCLSSHGLIKALTSPKSGTSMRLGKSKGILTFGQTSRLSRLSAHVYIHTDAHTRCLHKHHTYMEPLRRRSAARRREANNPRLMSSRFLSSSFMSRVTRRVSIMEKKKTGFQVLHGFK